MGLYATGEFTGVSGKKYSGYIYTVSGMNITPHGRVGITKIERGIFEGMNSRAGTIYSVHVKGLSVQRLKEAETGLVPIDADIHDELGGGTLIPKYVFIMDCDANSECSSGLSCCKTADMSKKECVKRTWAYTYWTPAQIAKSYPTVAQIEAQKVLWQKALDTATNKVDGCGINEATLMVRNLEDAKALIPVIPPQNSSNPPNQEQPPEDTTKTPEITEPAQPTQPYFTEDMNAPNYSALRTVLIVTFVAIIGGIAVYMFVGRK